MISKEEEALYDRQIRLWGKDAQQKIQNSKVFITGIFSGVAHELVKNLTLKGINTIQLSPKDTGDTIQIPCEPLLFKLSSFLDKKSCSNLESAHAISQGSTHLNSLLKVNVESFLDEDISICFLINDTDLERAISLNEQCRTKNIRFIWLLTSGLNSLMITDFGPNWAYTEERKQVINDQIVIETIAKEVEFVSLQKLWRDHQTHQPEPKRRSKALPCSFSDEFLKIQNMIENQARFMDGPEMEAVPVNAIMGGIAAQEAIKAITRKDLPIHNVVLFNGEALDSTIISIN